MFYLIAFSVVAIVSTILWVAHKDLKRYEEQKKPKPEYKIYQNGFGKFEVHFLIDIYEGWYKPSESMFLNLRLKDCKTIDDVHEAIKQYKEHIMKSEFKKVWP